MRPQRLLMSALLAAGLVPAAASAQYTVLQPIATPPLVAVQVVEPTTPGYPGWDLRYWKPAAVTTFNSCLSGFLGSGANCLASARRVYGDVCQAPSAAQCLDSQYFTTWCGRAEYAARGTSTTWSCRSSIQSAVSTWQPAGAVQRTVSLPDSMVTPSGTTQHYLERATGWYKAAPASSYFERDTFEPWVSSTGTTYSLPPAAPAQAPANVLFSALTVDPYALNGNAVASCDEYVYEKYYDYNFIERQAKAVQRSPRFIYDTAFNGGYITASNTLNLRSKNGAAAPDLTGYPGSAGSGLNRWTIKNVYHYVDWKRSGRCISPEWCGRLLHDGFLNIALEGHHSVNLAWHRRMNDGLVRQGFLDEELERLRVKQDALWLLYHDWARQDAIARSPAVSTRSCSPANNVCTTVPPPYTAAERAAAQQAADVLAVQLDAAVAEGRNYGCIDATNVAGPGISPCDWAPSMFTEFLFYHQPRRTRADLDVCRRRIGPGTITDAMLDARFSSMPALGPPAWATVPFTQYTTKNYVESTTRLEEYFTDIVAYYQALYASVNRTGPNGNPLRQSNKLDKTIGNSSAGLTFRQDAVSGVDPFDGDVCASNAEYDGSARAQVNLLGNSLEAYSYEINLGDDSPVHQTRVGGDLRVMPEHGVVGGAINVSYPVIGWDLPFPTPFKSPPILVGPVPVVVTAGLFGRIGVDGSASIGGVHRGNVPAPTGCVRSEMSMQVRGSGSFALGAFVAGGIPLGPFILGLKFKLDFVRLTLTATLNTMLQFFPSGPKLDSSFDLRLTGSLLSGQIVLFLDLELVIFTINIFELVLFEFAGPSFNIQLLKPEGYRGVSVCAVAELESIFGGAPRRRPSGCVEPVY